MKNSLTNHISQVFLSLNIEVNFQIYDCSKDVLPKWANKITLTNEFLIVCQRIENWEKIKRFTGKTIFELRGYTYWFEGETIIKETEKYNKETNIEDASEPKIKFLKKTTRLPSYLDNFIFKQLNAEYSPDFSRFDYNLDLNENETLRYLGTYFPRSYAESFCIFDNLFQNKPIREVFSGKDTLNILSVGCGIGGDVVGLLTIIEKYCPQLSRINILAIDGNSESLLILERIIQKFQLQTAKTIKLTPIRILFDGINETNIPQIDKLEFDFILSFKFICEIIALGKGKYDNAYYDFIVKFTPLLSSNGLCLLLDVTTKAEHNNIYNPILINSQVGKAVKKLKNIQTLIPIPCSLNEMSCNSSCFTQQHFLVSHSKRTDDLSKVSYRIIANSHFVKQLGRPDDSLCYFLTKETTCSYCNETGAKADGFLIDENT